MHAAIQLIGFWALAFVTLCVAVVLLNLFYDAIGNDLILHSLGKELGLAAFASLIEGASVWAVLMFLPQAGRALLIPAVIVAFIYKLAHLVDWSRYDIFMLLAFQIVICAVGASLFFGHFQAAIIIAGVFGVFLAIVAGFARSLGG